MADPMSGPITRCPWCSADLPDRTAERCPSCGAQLVTSPDAPGDIKGVTTLDTEAILRARAEVNRPRSNRILSFITGEVPQDAAAPAQPGSIAPPDDAVRLEMLRLRLAAETADLQAEAVALKADELARLGIHLSELGQAEPAESPGSTAEASSAPAATALETDAAPASQAVPQPQPGLPEAAPASATAPASAPEPASEAEPADR